MRQFFLAVVVALTLAWGGVAAAEGAKVFVEPFSVAGGGDATLAGALQNLFASRLSGNDIQVQQTPAGAQLLVKGSLTQLGKTFSIDVAAVEPGGSVVTRSYEQGEGQDAIIPALNKLAEKLKGQLVPALAARRPAAPQVPAPAVTAPAPLEAAPAPVVRATPVEPGAVVRADKVQAPHQRIKGVYVAMAPVRTLPDGSREVFLASAGGVHYFRVGRTAEQLAEAPLRTGEKVVALDSADLDGDGTPEAYLTVLRAGELDSQVWVIKKGKLERVADHLPYFFRALSGPGHEGKLYAQQMGRSEDFYGPVYEVRRKGSAIELKNPFSLPDNGNIYTFTRFADQGGSWHTVLLSVDGNLVVYSPEGKELWRSNDKYGGTETYIGREEQQYQPITGSAIRKIFLQPRMEVTTGGDLVVAQNAGTWVIGDSRAYSKHSVYAFAWNGASLEERWHTRPVETYLPDFRFDEPRGELVLLEVVKKETLLDKGASTVTVKKVN